MYGVWLHHLATALKHIYVDLLIHVTKPADLHCFQNTIRHSDSLCAGEQKYASNRKKNILETIQKLGLDCTEVRLQNTK